MLMDKDVNWWQCDWRNSKRGFLYPLLFNLPSYKSLKLIHAMPRLEWLTASLHYNRLHPSKCSPSDICGKVELQQIFLTTFGFYPTNHHSTNTIMMDGQA